MENAIQDVIDGYVQAASWPRHTMMSIETYGHSLVICMTMFSRKSKTDPWDSNDYRVWQWWPSSDISAFEKGSKIAVISSTELMIDDLLELVDYTLIDDYLQRYKPRRLPPPCVIITPGGRQYRYNGYGEPVLVCDYGIDVKSASIRK